MRQIGRITSAFFLAATFLWPNIAAADGALAIGLPPSVAKDGFAYGYTFNIPDSDKARERALEACRTSKAAPDSARSLCRLIGSFHDECVAIAMDPEDGTPGVGWAIAKDKQTAERRALDTCAATAGDGRRGACRLDKSACDASTAK